MLFYRYYIFLPDGTNLISENNNASFVYSSALLAEKQKHTFSCKIIRFSFFSSIFLLNFPLNSFIWINLLNVDKIWSRKVKNFTNWQKKIFFARIYFRESFKKVYFARGLILQIRRWFAKIAKICDIKVIIIHIVKNTE